MAYPCSKGGVRFEKMRVFRSNRGASLAQWAKVVQNPERAAVRGNHQIVVVDDHVVDGHRRQIELQRLPVRAIVEGNPNAGFGAGVKEPLALRIFSNSMTV